MLYFRVSLRIQQEPHKNCHILSASTNPLNGNNPAIIVNNAYLLPHCELNVTGFFFRLWYWFCEIKIIYMNALNIIALLVTMAALFSYVNYRYIQLPTVIGIMLIALMMSLVFIGVNQLGWQDFYSPTEKLLRSINFHDALMNGMLSFLLFAGALHVNINDLAKQKGIITLLATVGVVFTTFIVGGLSWLIFHAFNIDIPLIYCLLFGALIAPTDPIAVMAILKSAGTPKTLETKIAGESLFNDGIAVVVFVALLAVATGAEASTASVSLLFVQEAIGGAVYGFVIGYAAFYLLKSVNNYQVEALLTLALVMGGYALAQTLHISGPIAMVVAGLLIGNHGRQLAMGEESRKRLDDFWELIDEVLNAVLFVLIGLEVIILAFKTEYILIALAVIPMILGVRYISVLLPVKLLHKFRDFSPRVVEIMTWGGLRGGISIALALSLPISDARESILAVTYLVVAFSILVQGLSIERFITGRS